MQYLKLEAVKGDMAKGGLANKNTIVKVPFKYKKSVDTFLKDSTIYDNNTMDKSFPNKNTKKFYKKVLKSFRKLKTLGVFTSKYDFRSKWEYTEKESA